jgi:hypothetical protein
VRFWWIAAVILFLVSVGFAVEGYLSWRTEADLIEHGTLVQATVTEAGGGLARRVIAEDAAWDVKFQFNGQTHLDEGYPPYTEIRQHNGDVIPIHIDPNDPDHWTNRPTPPPLSQKLVGLPFVLGMLVICLLFALVRMARLKKVCTQGKVGWATILSLGQSSLAPRSYTARCTWADDTSPTVYSVFVPRRIAPQPGDKIQIAASPKSTLAITISDAIEHAQ